MPGIYMTRTNGKTGVPCAYPKAIKRIVINKSTPLSNSENQIVIVI
jgi:hypothetical protein